MGRRNDYPVKIDDSVDSFDEVEAAIMFALLFTVLLPICLTGAVLARLGVKV